MALDDTVTDRQAQTTPFDFGFRCLERLKEQIHLLSNNADTGVLNHHGNSLLFLPSVYRDHSIRISLRKGIPWQSSIWEYTS